MLDYLEMQIREKVTLKRAIVASIEAAVSFSMVFVFRNDQSESLS